MQTLRVVCYLNQFFGQLGGEDEAGVGPQGMVGAVGAARAVQQALGGAGTVVATVLCGDNYVAEHPDTAVTELLELVPAQHPDLVVTGPAFLAGRYGVACGGGRASRPVRLTAPGECTPNLEHPRPDRSEVRRSPGRSGV